MENYGGPVMKKLCAVILAILILTSVCAGEEKGPPTSDKERESYSVGYQVGWSMKNDAIDLDFERFVEGLRDSLEGKEAKLSPEEIKNLVVALKKRSREVQMRKLQEQSAKNLSDGLAFLEENKKKEGVKTTDSGLQYKIIKEGDGPTPGPTDTVSVHYRGTFIDGREFDSSFSRNKPEKFDVDGIIKGWTEALQLMKVGSKWQLFVPPDLAYGKGGMGERIPSNSVLVFEIELLGIEEKKDEAAASNAPQNTGQEVKK